MLHKMISFIILMLHIENQPVPDTSQPTKRKNTKNKDTSFVNTELFKLVLEGISPISSGSWRRKVPASLPVPLVRGATLECTSGSKWKDIPCNICFEKNDTSSKRSMWSCCGVTACVTCIQDFYVYRGQFTCPWCGGTFTTAKDFAKIFFSPPKKMCVVPQLAIQDDMQQKLLEISLSQAQVAISNMIRNSYFNHHDFLFYFRFPLYFVDDLLENKQRFEPVPAA